MSERRESANQCGDHALPLVYEIRIKGQLTGDRWSQWFGDMAVTAGDGETVIRGVIADQAALYGLLARLRDLALPLLSVNRVPPPNS